MKEPLRDAYLKAMGVPNLVARVPLPGAAPFRVVEVAARPARPARPAPRAPKPVRPQEEERAETPAPVDAVPMAEAPAVIDEAATAEASPPADASPAANAPSPSDAPLAAKRPESVASSAPPLAFGVYASASTLLVDSWPSPQRDWKFAKAPEEERALANNLMRALGLLGAKETSKPMEFGWPDSGSDNARRQALRFIEANSEGIERVILLGASAIEHLRDDSPPGIEVLYCALSLPEALAQPLRKAELWRELSPHCPAGQHSESSG